MSETSAWHALPPAEALRRSDSRPEGLSDAEAADRLRRVGRNAFARTPPRSAWSILLAQLRSVVVALLVAAAAVAVILGDFADAGAIAAVLALNVAIGFVTELRAHRAMEALLGLEVTRATVIRSGRSRELDGRDIVPGDVVVVEAGSTVPADARLLESAELRVVEASLTGESAPVDKSAGATLPPETSLPERSTMIYKATTAVAGRGTAVVVATGMATAVGRIGALTASVTDTPTLLERRLDALGRRLAVLAIGIALAVALAGLAQGRPADELIQTAIALAVAAVPEGLPVVGTIAMAVGVRRMARRRALVRHLPIVETLGSATVVCTDKTGTLTAGEMTATVLRLADREIAIPAARFAVSADAALTLRVAALANRGLLSSSEGRVELRGDPTETALLVASAKAGLDPAALRAQWPEIGEVPFSSDRMYMATFHRTAAADVVACVKGAPGRVLELCDRMRSAADVRELRGEDRERLLELNRELAGRGLRVLAVAMKEVTSPTEAEVQGLVWLGYVGLMDPPAVGVQETIAAFHGAGIRTIMLTGDQKLTGESVARDLGLLGPGEGALDGREVDRLSDGELRAAVERTAVFSRVSPEAKLRIVSALQQRGEIVAMLGDGVNDAAALRKADIGVAMGRGTDLAKEAADLTLEDDRFPTIAAAVEQGRVIFDNISKFVFYLFSCNLAEILVVLGVGLAGYPSPLLPLQILWLNLVTDTFPALALAVEPGEPGVMRQPPRDPRAAILSPAMLRHITVYGAMIAACSLAAFAWGWRTDPGNGARASTLTFLTLAFAQILHLGNARSSGPVVSWRRVLGNRFALGAVALAGGLQVLAVSYPPLARVLDVQPPSREDWLVVAALAVAPALVGQAVKTLRRS